MACVDFDECAAQRPGLSRAADAAQNQREPSCLRTWLPLAVGVAASGLKQCWAAGASGVASS
jgi:hypothetical protein